MIRLLEFALFRILVLLFALLPLGWLTSFSRLIFGLLFYVLAYRKKVVRNNLAIAFPDWSDTKREEVAKSFYRQFAEVLVETIKGLSMSSEELQKRYYFENAEIFEDLRQKGQSAIITGGHFGNWEWGSLSFPLWVKAPVIGIYKPLNNPYLEKYLVEKRCRHGLHLAAMAQTGRALIRYKNQPSLFVLIADQSPSNLEAAHWLPFFERETPFLNGLDKIARKSNYPVYYYNIQRIRSGYYRIAFRLLSEEPATEAPEAITRKFKEAIEQSIRQQPANWLWSHRRWKRARIN